MEEVYLDNSATTKPCHSAKEAVRRSLEETWHNPSSLYRKGMDAENTVNRARSIIARELSASPEEIFFTASGTEANNTAIFSAAEYMKKRGNRVITTSIEHPSVKNVFSELEKRGFSVVYLKPCRNGIVSEEEIRRAVTPDTVLISMMLVNNETGAIQPVEKLRSVANEVGAKPIIHCDAVQAFGKMDINVNALGVDLLSVSGHKVHAPKGVGALYKRKNLPLKPYIFGGGQEKGFRSGTENVPNISAFGAAVEELKADTKARERVAEISHYAREILSKMPEVVINSPPEALPYVLNISVKGYRSETLLHFLEADGILVSSGSACSKGVASEVLSEMGIDRELADSALRISFSRYNSTVDIVKLETALENAIKKLKRK